MPKGILVAAHGEAHEHHMLRLKAHHVLDYRQIQHFAAAPTYLCMLPMLPHLISKSYYNISASLTGCRAHQFIW